MEASNHEIIIKKRKKKKEITKRENTKVKLFSEFHQLKPSLNSGDGKKKTKQNKKQKQLKKKKRKK